MKIQYSNFVKQTENIFEEIMSKAIVAKLENNDFIDLSILDSAKEIGIERELYAKILDYVDNRKFDGYPSIAGNLEFRLAAAKYLKRRLNVEIDHETQVCAIESCKTGEFIFPRSILNPGDIVICPYPAYPVFHQGALFCGAIPFYVPLLEENGFLIDYTQIPPEVAKKAKIIWINYPNSPTGAVANEKWLRGLVNWAKDNEIIVCSDEAYFDFYSGNQISPIKFSMDGVISFFTFSKSYGMSMFRLGFAVGDKELVEGLKAVKNTHDQGVSSFIQDVGVNALNKKYDHLIESYRESYAENKRLLSCALKKRFNCESPNFDNAGLFLWQKAPKGMTGNQFADVLFDLGIASIPGSIFSVHALSNNFEFQNCICDETNFSNKTQLNNKFTDTFGNNDSQRHLKCDSCGKLCSETKNSAAIKLNPGENFIRLSVGVSRATIEKAILKIEKAKSCFKKDL